MFCVKCGVENTDTSKFCRKCGALLRQPNKNNQSTADTQSHTETDIESKPQSHPLPTTLSPNIAGCLCYVLGWISGIAFLIIEKDNKFIRFHAWQSIISFAILSVIIAILNSLTNLGSILFIFLVNLYWIIFALTIVLWVFLMFQAYSRKMFMLPIIGGIARRLSEK